MSAEKQTSRAVIATLKTALSVSAGSIAATSAGGLGNNRQPEK
jgi:hypothetical protein